MTTGRYITTPPADMEAPEMSHLERPPPEHLGIGHVVAARSSEQDPRRHHTHEQDRCFALCAKM